MRKTVIIIALLFICLGCVSTPYESRVRRMNSAETLLSVTQFALDGFHADGILSDETYAKLAPFVEAAEKAINEMQLALENPSAVPFQVGMRGFLAALLELTKVEEKHEAIKEAALAEPVEEEAVE